MCRIYGDLLAEMDYARFIIVFSLVYNHLKLRFIVFSIIRLVCKWLIKKRGWVTRLPLTVVGSRAGIETQFCSSEL